MSEENNPQKKRSRKEAVNAIQDGCEAFIKGISAFMEHRDNVDLSAVHKEEAKTRISQKRQIRREKVGNELRLTLQKFTTTMEQLAAMPSQKAMARRELESKHDALTRKLENQLDKMCFVLSKVVFAKRDESEETESVVEPAGEPGTMSAQVAPLVEIPDVPLKAEKEFVPGSDFDELVSILKSKLWPEAISTELICDETNEDECAERAEGVLDLLIEQRLSGLSFLDFGCGQGHIAQQAVRKGVKQSVGYDIATSGKATWESWQDNLLLTTDFEMVKQHAPYDVILLYDVLDHIQNAEPGEVLRQIANIKTPGGKIYVRCHPWCCRHGAHLYKTLNKAFAHLVFTDEELLSMGVRPDKVNVILHPRSAYSQYFKVAGLETVSFQPIDELVEPFFVENQLVSARIKSHWIGKSTEESLKSGKGFPKFQIQQSFLDFVLV